MFGARRYRMPLSNGCLSVENLLKRLSERRRFALAPIVKEEIPRLLMTHVLMDSDDVDAFGTHTSEYRLKFVFCHGEIAVNNGFVIRPAK